MKINLSGWLAIIVMVSIMVGCKTTVSTQPTSVVEVRSASPGSNYVWRDGDWRAKNRTYVYRQGYWTPARSNRTYSSGRWQQNRRGYYWRNGRWHR